MRARTQTLMAVLLGVAAVGLLATSLLTTAAWAQDAAAGEATVAQMGPAVLRTPAEMEQFDVEHPSLPSALPPFLPTMDFGQYLELKAAANAGAEFGEPRPGTPVAAPSGPPAAGPASCNGIGQLAPITSGFFPPDTHGAVGASHFVQVVNSAIRVYSKALTGNCPTSILLNVSLNGFFGYAAEALFDPRVVYDLNYGRWIVSAEAFAESSTVQKHFIAVSQTSDAAGSYFIYFFDMRGLLGANVFWDYPQIGYDEGAIILTGNEFNPNYIGSQVIFFDKHRMYRGAGFSFCFGGPFFDNVGTIAPPIVLDQSPYTVAAIASPGAGFVRLRKYTGTTQVCPTFLASNDIATATNIPAAAQQPAPCVVGAGQNCLLDTLDGRFQNAGTQFGEPVFGTPVRFWQTRTDVAGILPTPKSYKINADTNTIEESCQFFKSLTSNDWNPSIATNGAGTMFFTWSSTEPGNAAGFPEVRFTGKLTGDACSVMTAGTSNNISANNLTGNFDPNHGVQRWGDYSAVTLDPNDTTQAWAVNEKAQSGVNPTTWKSRFFNMHNP